MPGHPDSGKQLSSEPVIILTVIWQYERLSWVVLDGMSGSSENGLHDIEVLHVRL
jgi:hypothetical protein